jgi:Tol biopolymer transport system component
LQLSRDRRKRASAKVALTCLIAVMITVAAVTPILFLPKPSSASAYQSHVLSGKGNYLDPSVSPSGSLIAFASNRTGSYQIWLVNTKGSTVTRLTDSDGAKSDPQWSPAGNMIAFLSASSSLTSLWTINTDGSELAMVSLMGQSVQDFAWNPSTGMLAYDSYANGKWTISMAKIGLTPIQLVNDTSNSMYPSWNPNGKYLVYSSDRNGNFDIFVQNIATGAESMVTMSQGDNLAPRFSPNGEQLLFMSNRTGVWSIWTQDVNGSAPVNLLDQSQEFRLPPWSPVVDLFANAQWSPNGLSVLFVSSVVSGIQDAFVIQPNALVPVDELGDIGLGLIQTRISENLTGANSACWLPNGQGVVLTWNQGSDQGIWIVGFSPVTYSNPYGK